MYHPKIPVVIFLPMILFGSIGFVFFSSNLLFLACLVKYLKLPPVAIMLCLFSLNLFGLQVWFRRPQKYLPVQAV